MTDLHTAVTTAYISGNELVLEDFHETDPDVVAYARESDNTEQAAHRCLAMGARAVRLAGASLDTQLVEHRFETMTSELGQSVTPASPRPTRD